MFDTHAHLQFKAFEGKVAKVIKSAQDAGVGKIIVIGTDLETSKKAVTLAQNYEGVFASIGIHPHHVFEFLEEPSVLSRQLSDLAKLLKNPRVVAIGETGMDKHIYKITKYPNYLISKEFINLQSIFFEKQIQLALRHKKALIIHNREAVSETLEVLEKNWDPFLEGRSVFHCCEPDQRLLEFTLEHKVFIGIDGDITYDKEKQEFIKKVPLNLLVLETDSPYLLPEPLKSEGFKMNYSEASFGVSLRASSSANHSSSAKLARYSGSRINEPKNMNIIAEFISELKNIDPKTLKSTTYQNGLKLFGL